MSTPPLFPGLGPKIKAAYKIAVAKGAVLYTESEEIEVEEEGIPFEIRCAPTLAKKPSGKEESALVQKKKDPFAPPYEPELLVAEDTVKEDEQDRGESFVILLNKYCVTPRHFLLVTKEFAPQSMPLSPSELVAAYSIVKQLGSREKHLAFFNCGANSGASQPHKHIQFIPLSNGVAPFDSYIAAHRPENINAPFQLPLPYANFTTLLAPPPNDLASYLANVFLTLLDIMIDHLRRLSLSSPDGVQLRLSQLSYNVIITDAYIHLVPRTKEAYVLANGEEVSINSLGFAGMVLAKTESALEGIKEVGVLKVLAEVGYTPVASGDTEEAEEIVEADE